MHDCRATVAAVLLLATACVPCLAAQGGEAVDRGRDLVARMGCAACHSVPGVAGTDGNVGPPLTGLSRRLYIAGLLPNTRSNMVRWLLDPRAIQPRTAMPAVGLTEVQADDIAAFLATLK